MRSAIGLAFALVLVTATPAFAHVSVEPSEVAEGSFATLTLRVPNESDTAETTKLEVALPDGMFESARVRPLVGWTHDVVRDGDTVGSIVWEGGSIGPGEFEEFSISLGPIPEADTIELRTVQTYSDGEVVRWIDATEAGEEEPEHPAPTLTVTEGTGDHGGGGTATTSSDADSAEGTDPAAFAALLLAGVSLVAAVAALIFARKRPPA